MESLAIQDRQFDTEWRSFARAILEFPKCDRLQSYLCQSVFSRRHEANSNRKAQILPLPCKYSKYYYTRMLFSCQANSKQPGPVNKHLPRGNSAAFRLLPHRRQLKVNQPGFHQPGLIDVTNLHVASWKAFCQWRIWHNCAQCTLHMGSQKQITKIGKFYSFMFLFIEIKYILF